MNGRKRTNCNEASSKRGRRRLSFAVAVVLAGCGGLGSMHVTTDGAPSNRGGGGGAGGGLSGSGGSSWGGNTSSSGGARSEGGLIGPGNLGSVNDSGTSADYHSCDFGALWLAIEGGVGAIGPCDLALDAGTGTYGGDVAFDSDGSVIANTGISNPTDLQAWLASLANERWTCLAGQTISYLCMPGE
jgi:hypothetical protein